MKKTLYTAMIRAEDGIHIIRKNVSDEHGAYEDFEYAMQNKANEMPGELFGPFCQEDIVEDTTIE